MPQTTKLDRIKKEADRPTNSQHWQERTEIEILYCQLRARNTAGIDKLLVFSLSGLTRRFFFLLAYVFPSRFVVCAPSLLRRRLLRA
jgi:hypothetical protein